MANNNGFWYQTAYGFGTAALNTLLNKAAQDMLEPHEMDEEDTQSLSTAAQAIMFNGEIEQESANTLNKQMGKHGLEHVPEKQVFDEKYNDKNWDEAVQQANAGEYREANRYNARYNAAPRI
jgi:hypothetical protein